MYTKITFTFPTNFSTLRYYLIFARVNSSTPENFQFNWRNIRDSSFKVNIGTATATPGERTAINFIDAFNLDLNASGRYNVTRNVNEVTITSTVLDEFINVQAFRTDNAPDGGTVQTEIEMNVISENIPSSSISFTDIGFSYGLDRCSSVFLTVETSELATKILSPLVVNPNNDNPFTFEWIRGQTIAITVENADGIQATQSVVLPSLLNASNFSAIINNSPNGATVVIEKVNTTGLDLEYSLDNSTWQTSNTFSGLALGDYTLYVRDQFGCSFNKTFTVNEFGIYSPYFYISKANSFRFANRITFGDSANYKNDENTLSCEVDVKLPYKETQLFQSADIITTQFKSNYQTNIATIIKEDLNQVNVPIAKMTNNIGIKDKRDAIKYNIGSGKTGVYFTSGNTYDYITDAVIEPYALNGLLPEWAQIGNYIQIGTLWYLIENIVFDELKDADVIVFTNTYTGPDMDVVASSIYNRFNYEVYEFAIDMVNYIEEIFRVKLECIDTHFTTLTHLTELIGCKVKQENVLEINYWNTTNTDIFYSTGIQHKIRIPYLFDKGKTDENSEVHKTDTNAILLNADLYEADEFIFKPVTKEIWRKIMIALSHEKVLINGVGYVKNGNFNTEGPLEQTNLYLLTANMIKTGSVYNSQTSGNLDFNGSEVEVPGLISTESGYVRY